MRLVIALALILTGIFVVTQIMLPALLGLPLFPNVRFKRRMDELDEARAQTQAAVLDREIDAERRRAEEIRKGEQAEWASSTTTGPAADTEAPPAEPDPAAPEAAPDPESSATSNASA